MITIFTIIIVLFSAIIHEISHGYVAYRLGDPTAKLSGRLTLNPLKHIDPFGSIILPLLLSLLPGNILFGWAKPVPFNPLYLKNPEKGSAQIAFAGPLSNIFIALFFGALLRLMRFFSLLNYPFVYNLYFLFTLITLVNISLAIFNLLPIPPLDGAKVIQFFIPQKFYKLKQFFLEGDAYSILLLFVFIFFGGSILSYLVQLVFRMITGSSLY